jgi:predicted Zn-dependent protease
MAAAASAGAAGNAGPTEWPSANLELIHSARYWEAHDRADLAQLALKKLVAARPDSPDALLELGELDLRINNFADAGEVGGTLAARFKGSAAAREFAVEYRIATRDRLKFASIRRMVEIGQTADLRAALGRLFPEGPPGESLGLDYYYLLASSTDGFGSALEGVKRLAARHPDDPRYQIVLARMMLKQRELQLDGVQLLERLARRDDVSAADVDSALAGGLLRMGPERAPGTTIDAYLRRHPEDTDVAALRASQQQVLEERELLVPERLAAITPDLQNRLAHQLSSSTGGSAQAREQARAWLARSVTSREAHRPQIAATELRAAFAFSRGQYESEIDIAKDLEAQQVPQEAGELLASASRLDPTSAWLFETWVRWLMSHGRLAEAIDLLEHRPIDRKWSQSDRDALLASTFAQRASEESGDTEAAIADLEAAVRLSPRDPWTRYRLAEIYSARHEPDQGRRVMSEGAQNTPGDRDMRYAQALYLSSIEDTEAALAALEAIDPARRDAEVAALHDRLRVALARSEARRRKSAGDLGGARNALLRVEPIATHSIDRAAELAYSWVELGDAAHGIALMQPYLSVSPGPDAKTLLLYARVLNSADDDERLRAALEKLEAGPPLSEADRNEIQRMERDLDHRSIRALLRAHDYGEARRRLDGLLAKSPNDRALRVDRADLDLAAGHPRAARDRYAVLVAEDPDDLDTRLSYVRALTDSGDVALARAQLQAVEARLPPADVELRITLARRQLGLDEPAKALHTLEPLLAAAAPRSDVLMLAARAELAQRHFARARKLLDQAVDTGSGADLADARREREALDQRLESSVTAGVLVRHQPGTAGLSQIDALTIPSAWIIATGYESRITAHADAVHLDAGRWTNDPESSNFLGTSPIAREAAPLRDIGEQQTGVSPSLKWSTDFFSADLGSTPLGFVETNVVGGVEWTPTWHGADLTLGVSRRAVTSSELSYAGLKDPLTGESWGGVVQTGPYAGFGIYREKYDVSGSVQLAEITGTRVLDNRFAGARLSGSLEFSSRADMRADAGLTLNYWNYQHNLSNYTFGSGGYYSPQSYVSLSTPVTLDGKRAGWDYRVRAAVSYSVSEIRSIAFFPDDGALQATAARSALPDGYGSPYFPGYNSSGFGFTVYAAAERPVTRWLVAGFMFDLDRTDYYHPTTVEIYLRHAFGGRTTRAVAPPSPVHPY